MAGCVIARAAQRSPRQRGTEVSASLTFDDGPDETWTPRVLDELRTCGVSATFFLSGERVAAAPEIALAVADAGHEIALHCHRHIRHIDLAEAEIELDTRAALSTLANIGLHPTRWRTPWGIYTAATFDVAERHGLELVHWTIDTHDWRGDSAALMLERAGSELGDGSIVLMHDALGPGSERIGCENTLELIAPLSAYTRARGLTLAPVAEMATARAIAPSLS
jgi:peptidoglycan-N-acetylglucosamine deacetylase